MKKDLRGIFEAIVPLFLYVVILIVPVIFVSILTNGNPELTRMIEQNKDKYEIILAAITNIILLGCFIPIYKKDSKKIEIKEVCKKEKNKNIQKGVVLFFTAIPMCIGANLLLEKIGKYDAKYNEASSTIYGAGILLTVAFAVILAPMIEELIFRGIVFRRLRVCLGKWPAITISSLLFGFFHGNFTQGIFAFLIGIIFGYLYDLHGNIILSVWFHISLNLVSVVLAYTVLGKIVSASDRFKIVTTFFCVIISFVLLRLYKKLFNEEESNNKLASKS